MIIQFYLRFSSAYGQTLFVCGNIKALGDNDTHKAIPLHYLNNQYWLANIEIEPAADITTLQYFYILRDGNNEEVMEGNDDRKIEIPGNVNEIILVDTWNSMGDIRNIFYTQPFQQVLLNTKNNLPGKRPKNYTHEFKVKAPLLEKDEVICILGNVASLGNWQTASPILLSKNGRWWSTRIDFSNEQFPIKYKYGVYNIKDKKFVQFETCNDRGLEENAATKKITILHDGFAAIQHTLFKGAGVAIPLFSLRSKNSFGTGEITDIKLLADWAKATGLKLIQLLPINDTTATYTWKDSYPYAAISAFALHPIYLNLDKITESKNSTVIKALRKKQKQLNDLPTLNYEQVIKFKLNAVRELFESQKDKFLNDITYLTFFEKKRHWLIPYAAFCYLRNKYQTANFATWKSHKVYNEKAIQKLVNPDQKHYDEIAIHYFIQYHLHLQLTEATAYAHKNGIIVKGDIPIGIYRNSVDAWVAPELYNMDAQAGAPPDDFAVKGQNWGFPTYNWQQMQLDHFSWWRKRFEQMSNYFDAFRIDHILGFFRIWSIPLHAVEGVLGKFVPAIPVHVNELLERHISFNQYRYCKPFINDDILFKLFGDNVQYVKDTFLDGYKLKAAFNTQRKVEDYCNAHHIEDKIKIGLFDLISNVIFIEDEKGDGTQLHFRIAMENTSSFQYLDEHSKHQLKELYINYFYRRQDNFWRKEALQKLPGLRNSTNMLICGEDLGMVPTCVPDVMKQLGILSLEIQRMPKKAGIEFFHPQDAPYLSVMTPGTHDMSTIRAWWEEDKAKTQRFYNHILGKQGGAPFFCEPWINKEIILRHLHSPAMWSIFQLQDLLGMSETLRKENPQEERINEPANSNHYWNYRMHLNLEELNKQNEFNDMLKSMVENSGRA